MKPVSKSISETVENGDSSTVDYTGEETNEQGRVYMGKQAVHTYTIHAFCQHNVVWFLSV